MFASHESPPGHATENASAERTGLQRIHSTVSLTLRVAGGGGGAGGKPSGVGGFFGFCCLAVFPRPPSFPKRQNQNSSIQRCFFREGTVSRSPAVLAFPTSV